MNQPTRLPAFAFPPEFRRFTIGFDDIFDKFQEQLEIRKMDNYPPYNIKKISDSVFEIEVAVAGFSPSEVSVLANDRILSIEGVPEEKEATGEMIHQGISNRAWRRTFTLAEHVEVVGAESVNGILTVRLEKIIPEHKKPKTIQIEYK